VEAAWRLSTWDKLAEYLKAPSTPSFETSLGQIVLAARKRDLQGFQKHVEGSRDGIVTELAALGMEHASYERAYTHLLRLHMLTEVEQAVLPMLVEGSEGLGEDGAGCGGGGGPTAGAEGKVPASATLLPTLREARKDWDTRLSLIQTSYRNSEPILALRRCILALGEDACSPSTTNGTGGAGCAGGAASTVQGGGRREAAEHGMLLVKSAMLARKEGLLQTSYMYTLHAKDFDPPDLALEHARLLWDMQQRRQALDGLDADLQKVGRGHDESKRQSHAEALLLVANWTAEQQTASSDLVIMKYKAICEQQPEWEEGYFGLAKYYEEMLKEDQVQPGRKSQSMELNMIPHIVDNYGKTLQHGSKHIFEALPRMLTLWLDFGAAVEAESSGKSASSKSSTHTSKTETLSKLNSTMKRIISRLPPYQFLTALPQLTSRLCHPNDATYSIMTDVFLRLLSHHPQQTLWMMMAAHKSTDDVRKRRCELILNKASTSIKVLERLWWRQLGFLARVVRKKQILGG
jgi:serine/threonine-protein kinase ATR